MQATGLVECVSSLQSKPIYNQCIHDYYYDDGNDNARQLKQKLLALVWS